MVDDLDILIKETLKLFTNTTKEEQIAALKKEGWTDEHINFILNGKMDKQRIKKADKKGRVGAQEILLSVDERGEILKNILINMQYESRVDYLVKLGLSKETAETAANLVDELAVSNKKVDE